MPKNLRLESTHSLTRWSTDQPAPLKGEGRMVSAYPVEAMGADEEALAATLWHIIRKRKGTIACFTLLVVAAVTAASLLRKPRYEAVSRVVFYREDQDNVLGFKGANNNLGDDSDDRAALDTQIGILQSDALAMQVIKDLHLATNTNFARGSQPLREEQLIEPFHGGLGISKVHGTRLLEIRFRSTDPQVAADAANDLAKAYVEQNYKSKFQASAEVSDWLAKQLAELQARVEESQKKLVESQQENGIVGLDEKRNIVTEKLDDLNKELTAAQADRIHTEANYQLWRSKKSEFLAKLDADSLITRLKGQEAELQIQLAKLSTQLGPLHPRVRELQNQLTQLHKAIGAERQGVGERLQSEYEVAARRERMLQASLDQQKQEANQLNTRAIQYDILKRDFESNRQLYDSLLQKLKEAGISASLKSSNVRIVDAARRPQVPVEPNLPRNLAAALMLGLGGGLLLSFVLEKMNDKVKTPEQVEILSPLPALGIIPLAQDVNVENGAIFLTARNTRNGRGLLTSDRHASAAAKEPYKAVLTTLLLSSVPPPAVILITSPLPGEGKTTTSINLSIVLAQQGKRVLLVDADLQRPRIARVLGLRADFGLGAVLRESVSFEEAIIPSEVPNLFVLPADSPEPLEDTPLHANFRGLLAHCHEQFDHIIIDSPPVLCVADTLALSVHADSVLLVIRSGQTTKDAFLHAQDQLRNVRANVVGVVLNAADLRSDDFRRYRGYTYGYEDYCNPRRTASK